MDSKERDCPRQMTVTKTGGSVTVDAPEPVKRPIDSSSKSGKKDAT